MPTISDIYKFCESGNFEAAIAAIPAAIRLPGETELIGYYADRQLSDLNFARISPEVAAAFLTETLSCAHAMRRRHRLYTRTYAKWITERGAEAAEAALAHLRFDDTYLTPDQDEVRRCDEWAQRTVKEQLDK